MKKIIIGCLVAMVFGSFFLARCCSEESLKDVKIGKMYDYKFDDSEIPNFDTPNQYMNFVSKYIDYKSDGNNDYWQLPEQTWKRRTGDCEDMVILFQYLIETRLHIKTETCLVKNIGKKNTHILTKINDRYYELINNFSISEMMTGWEIVWIASYPEVIWMAYNYHDNVGKYY